MEKIFKYIDYRKFLADYYEEKKRTTHYFSYRYFALKTKTNSPAFLKAVINGKRNLTRPMIERFISAMGLSKKESVFFNNLVLFNQARTSEEKQEHYCVLIQMMDYVNEFQITPDQYEYLEKWHHSVVRELVCFYDFKGDYALLANTLRPAITPAEARESISLLVRLDLIKKQPGGTYVQTKKALTTGGEGAAIARRAYNKTMLDFAKNSLEAFPLEERDISGITMGISSACYKVIQTELAAFKQRIISIVDKDADNSRVYRFNVQVFPLSDDVGYLQKKEKPGEL